MTRLLSLSVRPLWTGAAVVELASASAQVFAGQVVGQLAGFATSIFVGRHVGPEAFGAYSFAVVLTTLLAAVPGAGLDMSAVRVSSRYRVQQFSRARSVLLVSGLVKFALGVLIMVSGWLLAEPIADRLLDSHELALPIRFAVIAAAALLSRDSAIAALQAAERFGQMALLNLASAGVRIGLVVLLLGLGALTLSTALTAFVAATAVTGALAVLVAWRVLRGPVTWSLDVVRELAGFSRWLVVATVLGTAANNLDVLALTRFAGAEPTGIYLAARTLALPIGLAGAAFSAALLPKLGRTGAPDQLWPYIRQVGVPLGAVTTIGATTLIVATPWLVDLSYGPGFSSAIPVFRLLVILYAAQLLTWPAVTLLLIGNRPEIIAIVNFLLLLATGIGYALFVPAFGPVGTAAVFTSGVLIALPCCYILAARVLPGPHTAASDWEAAV